MALTPMLLVVLAGTTLAIRRLPKYPRPCWLILAALAIDAFSSLALPVAMQYVTSLLSMNTGVQNHVMMAFLWTLPYSLISALVWGMVLFAVFDRPDSPKFLKEDDLERDILDRP